MPIDIVILISVFFCIILLFFGAKSIVAYSVTKYRALFGQTEENLQQELSKVRNLKLEIWEKRNELNQDELNMTVSNWAIFSSNYQQEADVFAFLFLRNSKRFKRICAFNVDIFKESRGIEFLISVFEKLHQCDRKRVFWEILSEELLGKPVTPKTGKDTEQIVNAISNLCSQDQIALLFRFIEEAPPILQDSILSIIRSVKPVVCSAESRNNFLDSIIDSGRLKEMILKPPDYLSHVVNMATQIMPTKYLGVEHNRMEIPTFQDGYKDTLALLHEGNKPLYYSTYKVTTGKQFLIDSIGPFLNSSPTEKSNPFESDPEVWSAIYKNNYEKHFNFLNQSEKRLLYLLAMTPFSVHSADLKEFCRDLKIDFSSTVRKLRKMDLIHYTDHHSYLNLITELKLLDYANAKEIFAELQSYEIQQLSSTCKKVNADIAIGKLDPTDILKKLPPQSKFVFENGKFQVITLSTNEGVTHILDMLISEASAHRFLPGDSGYFVTSTIRNIASDYNAETDKQDLNFLCSYYNKLSKQDGNIITKYLSFVIDKIYKRITEEQIEERRRLIDIEEKKVNTSDIVQMRYFSTILRQMGEIDLTKMDHYTNAGFIFSHIAGLECTIHSGQNGKALLNNSGSPPFEEWKKPWDIGKGIVN